MQNKVIDYMKIIFIAITVLYSFIAAYYFLNKPAGVGDEGLFISDLEFLNNEGWIEAIRKNVSIPYMLLVYPFSFFFKNFVALRIVNVLLLLSLLFYFYKIDKKKDALFYSYIMFYVSTIGFFYAGINDILYAVALIIFLNEAYRAANNKSINFNLALTALVVAFFTRQLFVVYLPIIIFGLYILYKSGIKFNKKSLIPLLIITVFLVLNLPSIQENGTLSFDKKSPPETISVTWAQRQYLAQLMVNEGKLKNFSHPSWEETQRYIEIHGKESLPNGILNGITHDYLLTIKEFFKDFAYCNFFGTRQLGLMLFISVLFLIIQTRKKGVGIEFFVPITTLMMLMIFSFIIISYVELRWLIPVFIMTIVFYDDIVNSNKISKYFVLINNVVLCLFSVYGIYNLINKIL